MNSRQGFFQYFFKFTIGSRFECKHAESGKELKAGYLYMTPSDHHLLIGENLKMLVTKGAHENRSRPAIDPLFRSDAVGFGSGVIGILLTGYLDDGTHAYTAAALLAEQTEKIEETMWSAL